MDKIQDSTSDLFDRSDSAVVEPTYDTDQLLNNYSYRYGMVDQFAAYMNTIQPYIDRVKYYMKTCEILGLDVPFLNIGSRGVFERPYWSRDNLTDKFIDEQGVPVAVKYWGLAYSTDEERTLLHKLWFVKQYQRKFKKFGHWVNESLEERKARYFEQIGNWNPAEYAKLQLNVMESEITRFQKEYTEFKAKNSSFENEYLKLQRLNAPTLVEGELLGNPSINWLAFNRVYQLTPFAFLWGMVAFKLFLIQQISNPPLTPDNLDQNKPQPIDEEVKRGPYEKSKQTKQYAIDYYTREVTDAIGKELRKRKEPNRAKIEGLIIESLCNKGYNPRTLRDYLSASKRTELFGEIHRQVSKLILLKDK